MDLQDYRFECIAKKNSSESKKKGQYSYDDKREKVAKLTLRRSIGVGSLLKLQDKTSTEAIARAFPGAMWRIPRRSLSYSESIVVPFVKLHRAFFSSRRLIMSTRIRQQRVIRKLLLHCDDASRVPSSRVVQKSPRPIFLHFHWKTFIFTRDIYG